MWGRRGRAGGERGGGGRGNAAFFVLALLLAILAPLAAKILQMSISRQREYHADAAAAGFTRNPLGLASALAKIAAGGAQVPGENRGTQHLFIINPLRMFGADSSALMSTHPPTEARIQRLRAMGGVAAGGGRSEVKRSRAGSSHGEPRTEPRPPRRRSRSVRPRGAQRTKEEEDDARRDDLREGYLTVHHQRS